VRFVRAQPARITWPLHVWGETHLEFLSRYRALKRAFTMTVHRKSPGTLRVLRSDGSGRQIEAYYEDGFGGEPRENWLFANPTLTLYCPDGYWRDITATTVTRSHAPGEPFLDPYPTVTSSLVFGETEIDNTGDVVAWPIWTITGPATEVEATNVSTGDSFTLTHTLAAGETITITTQRPTVRDDADTNLVSALNWPSAVLWGLLPGVNDVEFVVGGSAVGTSIELLFYPRHEGA
jgi:hypothetical protein